MKVVTVVGARPQFIKAAPVSRALQAAGHAGFLVHTGQHYDYGMSQIFFDELGIPQPDVNLGVGSGPHGAQTAAMLGSIEQVLLAEEPDWTLVYGDTNSTLAGALAAAKLHIPTAHIEAGLRSFNRRMPEEINRVLTDHISDLLFCPSQTAVDNLAAEGITNGVHLVGDVMADALLWVAARAGERSDALQRLGLTEKGFLLATVHRAENTDDPARLRAILDAFAALDEPIVFPVHPRTRNRIQMLNLSSAVPHLQFVDPVGYLDMVCLEQGARMILTDSGGIQKEAYWLGVPCVTLRDETEWIETVELGWNVLVGAETDKIVAAVRGWRVPEEWPALYGDGEAARRLVRTWEAKEWAWEYA
ncbi:MAG: UDP-N-acetylglucosamine 2-epimerase (non-hydrolyzing) [Anaerolineae bacterium]|nr:UDP-N-acetylglucosamine 2-epimerase (non-hydrolyzing) [Anaerolineae bacterium]